MEAPQSQAMTDEVDPDEDLWDDSVDQGLADFNKPKKKKKGSKCDCEDCFVWVQLGLCCFVVLACIGALVASWMIVALDNRTRDAVSAGDVEAVRAILENETAVTPVNVNAYDPKGLTALHYAALRDQREVAEYLLSRRADTEIVNNAGMVPLHFSSRVGSVDVSQVLLESRATLNPLDTHGWTPLFHAATWGHMDVARLLINYGAEPNRSATDLEHETPIHLARTNNHQALTKMLNEEAQRQRREREELQAEEARQREEDQAAMSAGVKNP